MEYFNIDKRFETTLDTYQKEHSLPIKSSEDSIDQYELLSLATDLNEDEAYRFSHEFDLNHVDEISFDVCEYKSHIIKDEPDSMIEILLEEFYEELKNCTLFNGSRISGSTWDLYGDKALSFEWHLPIFLPFKEQVIVLDNLQKTLESSFSCKINRIYQMGPDLIEYESRLAEMIFKQQYLPEILYRAAGINVSYESFTFKGTDEKGA